MKNDQLAKFSNYVIQAQRFQWWQMNDWRGLPGGRLPIDLAAHGLIEAR